MTVKVLQATTPVTQSGLLPSVEFVIIMQEQAKMITAQAETIKVLTLRIEALEAP